MTTDFYAPWQLCCGAYNVAEVGCVMDIEKIRKAAEDYIENPDVNAYGYVFRTVTSPAAVLELIRQRDELLAALHKITALPQHPMRKKAVEIAEAAIANAENQS